MRSQKNKINGLTVLVECLLSLKLNGVCDRKFTSTPSFQAAGTGRVHGHRGTGRRQVGAGVMSSGQLGVLLLQHLERRQIIWKGWLKCFKTPWVSVENLGDCS